MKKRMNNNNLKYKGEAYFDDLYADDHEFDPMNHSSVNLGFVLGMFCTTLLCLIPLSIFILCKKALLWVRIRRKDYKK